MTHIEDVTALGMRKALSRFTTGVTVVTSTMNDSIRGMTATAFTSVSLTPPLVLICVSVATATHEYIAETGRYGISVLGEEQKPLALHFAGGTQRPDLVEFTWRGGVPLLRGALVHLSCTVRDSYVAGDHRLYVGEVTALWYRDGEPLVCYTSDLRPLSPPRISVDSGVSW